VVGDIPYSVVGDIAYVLGTFHTLYVVEDFSYVLGTFHTLQLGTFNVL
jgi:hypothetical protein